MASSRACRISTRRRSSSPCACWWSLRFAIARGLADMRTDQDLLAEVNRSGFPLQIAIERLIRDGITAPCWRVRYVEHAWSNERTGSSGWVDLVLCNDAQVLNV